MVGRWVQLRESSSWEGDRPRNVRQACYCWAMTTQLPPDVQDWIDQRVSAGAFTTEAEAIAFAVRQVASPDEDLSWVVPLLDEARAEIAPGEGIGLEDFRVRMQARKDALSS
jgi:Arc/MetJ-type ribon-helix-helix transcriptional regulator